MNSSTFPSASNASSVRAWFMSTLGRHILDVELLAKLVEGAVHIVLEHKRKKNAEMKQMSQRVMRWNALQLALDTRNNAAIPRLLNFQFNKGNSKYLSNVAKNLVSQGNIPLALNVLEMQGIITRPQNHKVAATNSKAKANKSTSASTTQHSAAHANHMVPVVVTGDGLCSLYAMSVILGFKLTEFVDSLGEKKDLDPIVKLFLSDPTLPSICKHNIRTLYNDPYSYMTTSEIVLGSSVNSCAFTNRCLQRGVEYLVLLSRMHKMNASSTQRRLESWANSPNGEISVNVFKLQTQEVRYEAGANAYDISIPESYLFTMPKFAVHIRGDDTMAEKQKAIKAMRERKLAALFSSGNHFTAVIPRSMPVIV